MIPANSYFITGTDTGVGKTLVASRWIRAMTQQGIRAVPMKPVAAGCDYSEVGLRSEDALALIAASGRDLPYARVNRYALEPAIAPHIAAAERGIAIDLQLLAEDYQWLRQLGDLVCVEGAGGWRVPLGEQHTTADLVRSLDLDVVLVVGMRLGCLNHAQLTAESIIADGCRLAGWVANFCDPEMARAEANLVYLQRHLPAPLLWTLSYDISCP